MNKHTEKSSLIKRALTVSAQRIRMQLSGQELASALHKLRSANSSVMCSKDTSVLTRSFFPYKEEKVKELNVFCQREGFKTIFELVERDAKEIRDELKRQSLDMPLPLKIFLETYKELQVREKRSRVVTYYME